MQMGTFIRTHHREKSGVTQLHVYAFRDSVLILLGVSTQPKQLRSSSRPAILCLMNSPWWPTNLNSRCCILLQALHSQDVACLMLRSRFRKAKYADSMASWRSEPSTLSVTA